MADTNAARRFINADLLVQNLLTEPMRQYFYAKLSKEDPQIVLIKITELLKYLNLSHFSKGEICFNDEIDEVWHLWILQTQQYLELVRKLPSGTFIHHSSADYPDPAEGKSDPNKELDRQLSFLVTYIYNYGSFTEKTVNYWPTAVHLMNEFSLSLDELNLFLLQMLPVEYKDR